MQRILCGLLVLSLSACMQNKKPQETAFTYQTEELPSITLSHDVLEAYMGQSAAYSEQELFIQTIESLGDFERANFGCGDMQILETQVVSVQEEPAQVEELWQLQACDVSHRYTIIFKRDGLGLTAPTIHYLPN